MKWLLPPVLWLFCLLGVAVCSMIFPHVITSPYNYLGILIAIPGLWLLIQAERNFQPIETNINTFRKPDLLITDGVFSWTRNPMYLGFLVSLTGVVIVFNTLHSVTFVIIFYLAVNYWYIPFEEEAASRQFGRDYEEYSKKVRRWI